MKLKDTLSILALTGLTMAQSAAITIPPDQPICKLYSLIQLLGTLGGIAAAAYAGFMLATSHELTERNNAKTLLGGVVIGIIIIWGAPLVVQYLVGSANVCGW